MKGDGGWFVLLSILGVFIGLAMIWHGIGGNGLGSGLVLVLGIFMTIKEILDMAHG